MYEYYIDKFKSRKAYHQFLEYAIAKSEYFSLVFFQHVPTEEFSPTAQMIYDRLMPYQVHQTITDQWPGTITFNSNHHIYQMSIYKCKPEVINILKEPDSLFDWDYPMYPMDLAFFRNGYCWISSTAHEEFAAIYLNSKTEASELTQLGIELSYSDEIEQSDTFALNL